MLSRSVYRWLHRARGTPVRGESTDTVLNSSSSLLLLVSTGLSRAELGWRLCAPVSTDDGARSEEGHADSEPERPLRLRPILRGGMPKSVYVLLAHTSTWVAPCMLMGCAEELRS